MGAIGLLHLDGREGRPTFDVSPKEREAGPSLSLFDF